jgi:hypothetical protein
MNFWDSHTVLFCLSMYFFPRLTLFFATPLGGILWWVGLFFVPRLLVACLATANYGLTNPFLCCFVWFWALKGDLVEKQRVRIFSTIGVPTFRSYSFRSKRDLLNKSPAFNNNPIDVEAKVID